VRPLEDSERGHPSSTTRRNVGGPMRPKDLCAGIARFGAILNNRGRSLRSGPSRWQAVASGEGLRTTDPPLGWRGAWRENSGQ